MDPLVGGLLITAFALVVLYAAARAYRDNQRIRLLPGVARKAGLHYSESDRFNSTAIAFPLLREGDGRSVEHLMWREQPEGLDPPVRVFDYSYYDEYQGNDGRRHQTWHPYTCALARHNGNWPSIRIVPEGLMTRALRLVGLPDIDFESEEFNRAFSVQCPDRRFASALIDPRMMDLLLSSGGALSFETKGRFLLAWGKPLDAPSMPGLHRLAEKFLDLVPPAVRELYPSFPDGAGTEAFPLPPQPPSSSAPSMGMVEGMLYDEIPGWARQEHSSFEWAPDPHLADSDEAWDPTPGVDHDLDGHVVEPIVEDPWRDAPLLLPERPETAELHDMSGSARTTAPDGP